MKRPDILHVLRSLGIWNVKEAHTGWVDSPCPFALWRHRGGTDRRPSFGVKINDEGISGYICHTCKARGRVSSLVRSLEHLRGVSYGDLAKEADKADLAVMAAHLKDANEAFAIDPALDKLPEPLMEEMYDGVYPCVDQVPEALAYVQSRGISISTCHELELMYDAKQRRVLFPVRDNNWSLYGWTGRGIDDAVKPKVRDYAGLPKRHLILGEHRWEEDLPTILLEGLFGYAHFVDIGVEQYANVGALLGSEMTAEKAVRCEMHGGRFFLLLDNDAGGEAGIFGPVEDDGIVREDRSAIQRLKDCTIYIPTWPEGKTDPDELELDEVVQMLEGTLPYNMPALQLVVT